jgi:hypothetical protein
LEDDGEIVVKYSVDWKQEALEELADIWNHARDPDQVTEASNEIDRFLERDPFAVGESREGAYRVLFVEPLGVTYEIRSAAHEVIVARAWRYKPA